MGCSKCDMICETAAKAGVEEPSLPTQDTTVTIWFETAVKAAVDSHSQPRSTMHYVRCHCKSKELNITHRLMGVPSVIQSVRRL